MADRNAQKPANRANATSYVRRFSCVIEYIHTHLDDAPDLNRLAEAAAMSPWHWHRIWQATYGESVVATVRRLRLMRAAAELSTTDTPIRAIWKRAGYGSQAAFTRSFKQAYGLTPAKYRSSGPHTRFRAADILRPVANGKGGKGMFNVDIKHFDTEILAGIPHKGAYMQIGEAFQKLGSHLTAHQLTGRCKAMKALYFSDPTSVPEDELQSIAGAAVDPDFPIEAPLERFETQAGDYAVLHYKGPYENMRQAYDWLYGEWLVQSGREPADAPAMEIYLNDPYETAPADLLTEICMPLK
ncbi:GyrI-like domain-containing protein [Roseibium sp. RKSG952]|uniref:AraC family transcriptional regulator n=1 Tax=Roseibium sp. RKSG952 TaxID=2529384 RepID=UPI0012BD2901|nr:AraC family transcriptional regulator [Roseibium sp. RKSG952]MTH98393.1 AraC family transcriptional regulator [Roseibium sp. RKSG952]